MKFNRVVATFCMLLAIYGPASGGEIGANSEFYKRFSDGFTRYYVDIGTVPVNNKRVSITFPNGKRMVMKNATVLSELFFQDDELKPREFFRKYPKGEYRFSIYPPYEVLKLDITHDFPSTPNITFPTDNAEDIELAPTITWSSISGITRLSIEISNEEFTEVSIDALDVDLPVNSQMYTVPSGLFQPGIKYGVCVDAINQVVQKGNGVIDYHSLGCVDFRTVHQR